MAAFFTAASSTRLLNSTAPVTTVPWTVSFWFNLPAGTDRVMWHLTDTAGTQEFWVIYRNGSNTLNFDVSTAGGGQVGTATATAITNNAWTFVVLRGVSATNRRTAVLHPTGVIDHAQDTTSATPAGIDAVGLGEAVYSVPDSPMDGYIAEYAMWNADVQGDGAQLQNSTLRQMAYGGPFSMTHMAANLVEYRSFRSALISSNDRANEIYVGAGKLRQVWTNVNGVKLGKHVPLPAGYVKQYQGARLIPVL